MRDEETGTYWQQISGMAISGPLAGRMLKRVPSDELSFAVWKSEQPEGTVLKDLPSDAAKYSPRDWDARMRKAPTVLSYAQAGLAPRDLMLGVQAFGAARAYPNDDLVKQKLIKDRVGAEPIVLVLGPDGQSVRAFRDRIPGSDRVPDFYRTPGAKGELMIDDVSGTQWNFQGCAVGSKAKGACQERIEVTEDYWFDWRHYNPHTTVYGKVLR